MLALGKTWERVYRAFCTISYNCMRIYNYLKHFSKKEIIYSGKVYIYIKYIQFTQAEITFERWSCSGLVDCSSVAKTWRRWAWAQGESSHRLLSLTECKIMGVCCKILRNRFHTWGPFIQGYNCMFICPFLGHLTLFPETWLQWASARKRFIICKTQCKMKMWGLLFKMYKEFQDSDCRALNQWWNLYNHQVLCDCTSPGPS